MAFIKMVTQGNGTTVVEVFIKTEELLKVLHQQGITAVLPDVKQVCLTFKHSKLEEYDY